jgi:hypothetical protein
MGNVHNLQTDGAKPERLNNPTTYQPLATLEVQSQQVIFIRLNSLYGDMDECYPSI